MNSLHLLPYLLVLLLPVPFLCGVTEYYVRPIHPTSTPCPGQPCLTFSQLINCSDCFFKSNTVFWFLPGTYKAITSLTVSNIHNVSLVAIEDRKDPEVMFSFTCASELSGFTFWNANYITIDGLSIVVHSQSMCGSEMTGIRFVNVTGLSIQHSIIRTMNCNCSNGIDVLGGMDIEFRSLTLTYGGISVTDTHNINITTVRAIFCKHGVNLLFTRNAIISNTDIKSAYIGITIQSTTNVGIIHTTIQNASNTSIYATNTTMITISYTIICSGIYALVVRQNSDVNIVSIVVQYSKYGIVVRSTTYTRIWNTNIVHCSKGIAVHGASKTDIRNTTLQDIAITKYGMYFITSNFSTVSNTVTYHGILVYRGRNMIITDSIMLYGRSGIIAHKTTNISIFDTKVMHSNIALAVFGCETVTLNNITAVNWTGYCMSLEQVTSTILQNIVLRSGYIHSAERKEFGIVILNSFNIIISKSVFILFNTPFNLFLTSVDVTRQSAVMELYDSSNIFIRNCTFQRNNMTAMKLVNTHIDVLGTLTFIGNRAYQGAAMTFVDGSSMTLSESGYVLCEENAADDRGGAIYITNEKVRPSTRHESFRTFKIGSQLDLILHLTTVTECFLKVRGKNLSKKLIFTNNSAGQGGDALYGGSLGSTTYYGTGTCLKHFQSHSVIVPETLSVISSDPSRVCFCNKTGMPDCLKVFYPKTYSIYPGETIGVSVVAMGHNLGTVAGTVFAQFLSNERTVQLDAGQLIQGVQQHYCNKINYTIFTQGDEEQGVLVLTAAQREKEILRMSEGIQSQIVKEYKQGKTIFLQHIQEFSIFIRLRLLKCPPGFEINDNNIPSKCDCVKQLWLLPHVTCNIQYLTIERRGLVWIGPFTDDNNTVVDIVSAQNCPLNYCRSDVVSVNLNEPDTQCNYNHSGTLCGGCQPGLSLALGSAQCLKCSNRNVALLIPLALAGVVLVFFIKVLDLTISQGFTSGLIFYANIIKPNQHIFLPQMNTNPLTLFIAWLNLDLGIETCFVDGLTAYWKTWLQFVFPLYIWAIAGLIIISTRYSIRLARVMGNNSVRVLATLFLLSYAKLLHTIITIMSYTVVETPHGQKTVWSADGNIDYPGSQHAPLFFVAIATLLFLWLPYTLLLLIGQWLRKINHRCVTRILLKLKPFLDAHYGPLKDKHHYWFGALLCMRAIILLISAVVPANNFSVSTLSISLSAGAVTSFTSIGPAVYRNNIVSTFEIFLFINLGLLGLTTFYTNAAGGNQIAVTYTLIGVAFIQFIALVFYQIYSLLKPKFFHCHTHHNEGEVAEGVWRFNTSLELWKVPHRTIPYQDATTAL